MLQLLSPSARVLILVLLGGALFVALIAACIFLLPGWLVALDTRGATATGSPLGPEQLASAKNGVRATLIQMVVGLAALTSIAVAWAQLQADRTQLQNDRHQLQEQLNLTRQGQIAERFTRAVDQLGSDNRDVQLGGIYALEQMANESNVTKYPTDRTRLVVFEVITAYVRQHSPRRDPESLPEGPSRYLLELPTHAPEVQAAMNVLERRDLHNDDPALDLHGVDLRGASLDKARLPGADLTDVNLWGAHLTNADLHGATLRDGNLMRAYLVNARLQGANLVNVNLEGANLEGANLREALADKNTKWPNGFDWHAAGIRMQP